MNIIGIIGLVVAFIGVALTGLGVFFIFKDGSATTSRSVFWTISGAVVLLLAFILMIVAVIFKRKDLTTKKEKVEKRVKIVKQRAVEQVEDQRARELQLLQQREMKEQQRERQREQQAAEERRDTLLAIAQSQGKDEGVEYVHIPNFTEGPRPEKGAALEKLRKEMKRLQKELSAQKERSAQLEKLHAKEREKRKLGEIKRQVHENIPARTAQPQNPQYAGLSNAGPYKVNTQAPPGSLTSIPPTQAPPGSLASIPPTQAPPGSLASIPPTQAPHGSLTSIPPTQAPPGSLTSIPPTQAPPGSLTSIPPTQAPQGSLASIPPTQAPQGSLATIPPQTNIIAVAPSPVAPSSSYKTSLNPQSIQYEGSPLYTMNAGVPLSSNPSSYKTLQTPQTQSANNSVVINPSEETWQNQSWSSPASSSSSFSSSPSQTNSSSYKEPTNSPIIPSPVRVSLGPLRQEMQALPAPPMGISPIPSPLPNETHALGTQGTVMNLTNALGDLIQTN